FISLLVSCTTEKFDVFKQSNQYSCDTTLVSYQVDIVPLLQSKCIYCHNETFETANFKTYEGIKAKAENGKLYQQVVDLKKMPQNDTLSKQQIQLIDCWISQGYLNN